MFREVFYRDMPHEKVRRTIRKLPGQTHLVPPGQPRHPRVCTGCGRVKKPWQDVRGRVTPAVLPRKAVPGCHRSPRPGTGAGWALGCWEGSPSLAEAVRVLGGLCRLTAVKLIHVQEVLLKICWKLSMSLTFLQLASLCLQTVLCLYGSQREFVLQGEYWHLSLFLMLSLFGVLCISFKWGGLELMDVLPSVFYSLKVTKCIHFIFI